MEIIPCIWTADNHQDKVVAGMKTEVIDGRLERMSVLSQPAVKGRGIWDWHGGGGYGCTQASLGS